MMVTNCLPSTWNVVGAERACDGPRLLLQRTAPFLASRARKYPSLPPVNSRSEPVVSRPLSVRSYIGNVHLRCPVIGSRAMTAPCPVASVQLFIGPLARNGGTDASATG